MACAVPLHARGSPAASRVMGGVCKVCPQGWGAQRTLIGPRVGRNVLPGGRQSQRLSPEGRGRGENVVEGLCGDMLCSVRNAR